MDITATITYMSIRFVLLGRLRRSNARYWSIILRKVIPFSDAVFFFSKSNVHGKFYIRNWSQHLKYNSITRVEWFPRFVCRVRKICLDVASSVLAYYGG